MPGGEVGEKEQERKNGCGLAAEAGPGKSLLDKFDFKSLLAKKDKAPAREAAE